MQNRDKFQLGKDLEAFLEELANLLVVGSDASTMSLDLFTEHKRFDYF